jgi:hypothetical protein
MLRSLELVSSREPSLRNVLAATTNLQSLTWVWNHDKELEDDATQPIIDLDRISRALPPVKATVTRLEIGAVTGLVSPKRDAPYLKLRGSLSSLREFTRLQSVNVELVFLVAARSLEKRFYLSPACLALHGIPALLAVDS